VCLYIYIYIYIYINLSDQKRLDLHLVLVVYKFHSCHYLYFQGINLLLKKILT
jgi:hypothetical protein